MEKKNIIFKVISILYILVSIVFFVVLTKFNMLPVKYLCLIGAVLFVISILEFLVLFVCKKKVALKIITSIILLCFVVIYIYGINYISSTMTFIEDVTAKVEETEEYYILTLNSSEYDSIKSIDGKVIYTFMADEDYTDIKEEIVNTSNVVFKDTTSIKELGQGILNNNYDLSLVSNSQYEILCDEFVDFETNIKKIHTLIHKFKKIEESKEETTDYTIDSGVFNVYISGIDTAGDISTVARSDANIVVTVNTKTHDILLTSIPRDYYVVLHSKGKKDKLTHSGVYGIKETYTTVEDLLNIDINYYVRVNFTTLEKIVDALGGIEVDSEYAFETAGYSFKKGKNTLNGAKALAFSRERYSFASGDRQRIKNQQAVIKGILNKVMTSETILTKYTKLLKSLSNSFQTNIKTEEINMLVKSQMLNMSSWNISTNSLNGSGTSKTTYTYGYEKLYVMIPYEDSVNSAITKINDVLGK